VTTDPLSPGQRDALVSITGGRTDPDDPCAAPVRGLSGHRAGLDDGT